MTIRLALGVPQMGKTQFLMDFVSAHAREHLFFVVDRAGDWQPETGRYRCKFRKWADTFTDHALVLKDRIEGVGGEPWYMAAPPDPLDQLGTLKFSPPPTGVVSFGYPWEGLEVAELARIHGNVTYVDDEIDEVAIFAGWQKNPIRQFAHRGRHLPNAEGVVGKIHVLGAARRAQSLHVDMTNLADEVAVFRVQGFRTFQRLLEDRIIEPGEEDRIRTQEPYHFKLWRTSGESSWGKLKPLGAHITR